MGLYAFVLSLLMDKRQTSLFSLDSPLPQLIRAGLVTGLALILTNYACAQEGPSHAPGGEGPPPAAASQGLGPIVPNRPGFTNGSATIAPGDALAENGIAQTRALASAGGETTLDFPETNLRVGVTPALEADVVLPDFFQVRGGDHGFGDGAVGVKYQFYQSKDGNTKASAAPSVSLPTHTAFSSGQVDPTLLLGVQTASGSRWSLASNLVLSNPTVNAPDQGTRRLFTTIVSGSVAYTLTPKLSVYCDSYDVLPREGPPSPVADAGFAFLVNKNLQLDAEVYEGLGGAAPVRILAAGLSVRL